ASAAAIRAGDEVHTLAATGAHDPALVARMAAIPIATELPIAQAIRTSELVWCAREAELTARYLPFAHMWRGRARSWGAVPFAFEGRTIGALAISFAEEHELRAEEREFLTGVGQLVAQALERARLYEALRTSEEQLRVALLAARAAIWKVDLATMTSTRDP